MSEPIEDRYRQQMNDLASLLDGALNGEGQPRTTGFVLLMFDFGSDKRMNYISNADRKDMLAALHELLANFEGRMMNETRA